MTDFSVMRGNMVDGQILPNRVTDPRLIDAMLTLPRELFVSEKHRSIAYVDEEVEILPNRYLMEPRVFARLAQALVPRSHEVALYVGCGTGYGAAILAHLCGTVIALESEAVLVARAADLFLDLEIDNAVVVEGFLDKGYAKQGPYDLIFIEGAVVSPPRVVLEQLVEGGRLATVVKPGNSLGQAAIFTKVGGTYGKRVLFDAAAYPLPGFEGSSEFVF